MKNNKSVMIIVGVLVVLLAVVIFLVMTRPATEVTPNGDENGQSEVGSVAGDELNSIIVNDQIPGDVVFYNSLTLSRDGFIVVREDDNGVPGDIVGTHFVEAGDGMTGNVELDEPTTEGSSYFVELYVDSNGDGVFDAEDQPVATSSGTTIRVRINTTEDLPEIKG